MTVPLEKRHDFIVEAVTHMYGGSMQDNAYLIHEIERTLEEQFTYPAKCFNITVAKIMSQRPNRRAAVTLARYIFSAFDKKDEIHWEIDY